MFGGKLGTPELMIIAVISAPFLVGIFIVVRKRLGPGRKT